MWSDQVASVKKYYKAQHREKKKRRQNNKMGRKHEIVDRPRLQQQSESSRHILQAFVADVNHGTHTTLMVPRHR